MSSLYKKLKDYGVGAAYPFHMPGHKRRLGSMTDPYRMDITEIDGFDNLHHAEGILQESMDRAAQLYGSEETRFLVNGSTCGILSAVSAAVKQGRREDRGGLIMARNNHKAALHAAYLMQSDPIWLFPRSIPGLPVSGRILPADVDRVMTEHPEASVVLIVSPTYDGVISPVAEIARVVHGHGGILIVDEAHGAHYGLSDRFPLSSVRSGADLVIHSLHKTLPSLTQTALLHVNGERIDRQLVRRFLAIYQTSSPSYVLMASMDECIRIMAERGQELGETLQNNLAWFYRETEDLQHIRAVHADDPSKILILPGDSGLSGSDICDILRMQDALELEMGSPGYALALCSVGDEQEGFIRLSQALHRIDAETARKQNEQADAPENAEHLTRALVQPDSAVFTEAEEMRSMSLADAMDAPWRAVRMEDAEGEIAAECTFLYPPGIPIIVPGERITEKKLRYMLWCRENGYELQGMEDITMQNIRVLDTYK